MLTPQVIMPSPPQKLLPSLFSPDDDCVSFVKGFESFVPYVYDDKMPPVNGAYREWKPGMPVVGTLTVLYGHTDDAAYPLKIKDCVGKRFDEVFASRVLKADMQEVTDYINNHVTEDITQGMGNAMESFGFNCGVGNLQNIIRRVNLGNYDEARAAFDLYVYSKGERMLGLQRRRDGEQALWDANPVLIPLDIVHHTADVDGERLAA